AGAAGLVGPRGVRSLRRSLQAVERCLLPPPHIERFVADFEPDVVVSTHLAELGSTQADYIRAARRLGIHTAYLVFSWDNLTNKGLVRDLPELVLVWNELQAQEAVELQEIPRERVKVTGASAWDHWFEWEPSRSRDGFCVEVGLRDDHPILLYVCSSHFVAPNEVAFVRRWLAALRARGGALADAGVIVRPHPRNAKQWSEADLDDPQVRIWPRYGEEPLDETSRRNYFDSIHHSAAVVGINTSAQIESAIVGRPVHTVLDEEFRATQQGTLHFQYLQADDFGHVYAGRTMDEHLAQLEESLGGRGYEQRNERFVQRFVRPLGRDVAGSPLVVEALEELAARPAPEPENGPPLAPTVRAALRPVAALAKRRQAERRREKVLTPLEDLRRRVRRLARGESAEPIVAGPWLGDEIGELLYWIPFLRWAQSVTFGLGERLVLVARASSVPWYAGIGSTVVTESPRNPDLPASWIEEVRGELAQRRPGERSLERMLEFAPLDPPVGLHLPGEGRAFVGDYGAAVYLAALAGVPAIGVIRGEQPDPDDLRVARSFLGRPPFGTVRAVPPEELEQALAQLEPAQLVAS
ncbi:MAG TPA: hypothetical protein VJT84_05595, partial [Gaiellaceae bacterium]|nr:hypothetical protein [Gaiellaceae bacterium]